MNFYIESDRLRKEEKRKEEAGWLETWWPADPTLTLVDGIKEAIVKEGDGDGWWWWWWW